MSEHPTPASPESALTEKEAAKASQKKLRLIELLQTPFDVRSVALTGLFVLAVFYTMYFTRAILLPLVLALLVSQLLAPIVRALARWKIPQMVGSGLVLLFLCGVFGYGISFLAVPAMGWLEKAPYSVQQVQKKLEPLLKRPMQRMAEASGEMAKMTAPAGTDPAKKPIVQVEERNTLSELAFVQTPEFIASALTFLILLYFLLGYHGVFLGKLVKVIPRFTDKKTAVAITNDIEAKISSYLVTVTMINTGLGCAIAVSMYFLDMPNPLMWGAAAAVLNFVPYLGAFVGIVTMTLAALLSFHSLGHVLLVPGAYLVLAVLEGNFVTPFLLGRSLTLNPLAIVISVMFWGWMWGIIGIILAVPILATMKILCDHIEPLAPIGEFLSD
ncbi:MAG: AI-2E family transporter [Chthoniobacteraceae bacterium]